MDTGSMEASKTTRSKAFTAGFALAVVAAICNIVAFSLDQWLYTPLFQSAVGLDHAGLWSFCVQSLMDESGRASISGIYYGCHWIFDTYFDKIRWTILNPVWFIVVQIMSIISLLLSCLAVISLIAVMVRRTRFGAHVFGTLAIMSAGLFSYLEALIFAVYARDTQFYNITNIQTKALGAAWYLNFIAALFATASLMALIVSVISTRRHRRRQKRELTLQRLATGQHATAARPAMRGALSDKAVAF